VVWALVDVEQHNPSPDEVLNSILIRRSIIQWHALKGLLPALLCRVIGCLCVLCP
jgi:hypothetical protein